MSTQQEQPLVQQFTLNPLKKDQVTNQYRQIEIPVAVSKPVFHPLATEPFCSKKVNTLQQNSTCQIEFKYSHGQVCLIACLYGPSESKFASKQDFQRAFVEVNLKVPGGPAGCPRKQLIQNEVRQNLEQIIMLTSYPKQIFTFQVTVTCDYTQSSQIFSACLNSCICLLNQAGIAQRQAPFASMTFASKTKIDTAINSNKDGSGNAGQEEQVDVVANPNGEIMWVRTNDYNALMDREFERKVKAMAKEICAVTFN